MFAEVFVLALLCVKVLGESVKSGGTPISPFILTPLIENGETEKAKRLSAVDPSLFAGVDSHATYFTVNKTGRWNLQKMPITWGSNYSLLFIDNPVGVGFSLSEGEEYATNEDTVGACLLNFIQQFLQVFPELRTAPLFIAGESYAGKYIPAFGHYIHHNQDESMAINLRGLAIGDGWTDPPSLLHYSERALQVGLVDPEQAEKVHKYERQKILVTAKFHSL